MEIRRRTQTTNVMRMATKERKMLKNRSLYTTKRLKRNNKRQEAKHFKIEKKDRQTYFIMEIKNRYIERVERRLKRNDRRMKTNDMKTGTN